MLNRKNTGLHGRAHDGNRSRDSWQVEENADMFGNQDEIAIALNSMAMENINFHHPHKFGDHYTETVFLDIDEENFNVSDGKSTYQTSFDLGDMVKSTETK